MNRKYQLVKMHKPKIVGRKLVVALVAVVIATFSYAPKVGAKGNVSSASTLLRDAGSLLQAGKYDKARALYLEALKEDSLNQHALKNIGYIYSIRKDYKNSLRYLQKAEAIGHADADTYNLLGIAYAGTGDTLKSLKNYKQAINLAGDNAAYVKNYGAALVTASRFSEAIAALDSAHTMTPKDGEIDFLLGNCYAGLAKPEEALKSYRAAIESGYDTGELRYHLGMVSETAGDLWSAEEHYGIGISKDPGNLELRQRLAVLYLRAGVYNQAERLFKDNLSRDLDFVKSRIGLGTCYAFMGYSDSAYAELKTVRETHKDQYEAMKQMVEGANKYYKESKRKADSVSSR